ncbi:hypothetical protein [Mesorhizobium sp.]|uniref:hypothetical protein n=1 Tax=Mesorhizobium sp. TaxID=1871066 RepID=UPI0025BD9384|nr:hypothetical protein [Mesorhizobium sp.]
MTAIAGASMTSVMASAEVGEGTIVMAKVSPARIRASGTRPTSTACRSTVTGAPSSPERAFCSSGSERSAMPRPTPITCAASPLSPTRRSMMRARVCDGLAGLVMTPNGPG